MKLRWQSAAIGLAVAALVIGLVAAALSSTAVTPPAHAQTPPTTTTIGVDCTTDPGSSLCGLTAEERHAADQVIVALNLYFDDKISEWRLHELIDQHLKVLGSPGPVPYDSESLQDSSGNLNYSQVGQTNPTGCGGQPMPFLSLNQLKTRQSYVCQGTEWVLIVRPKPEPRTNPYKDRAQHEQEQDEWQAEQQRLIDEAIDGQHDDYESGN